MSAGKQARFDRLARAYPVLPVSARLKHEPEDFVVTEVLPFELADEGEHVWLQVRKRNCNTDWLAGRLAAFASVKRRAVGYAGLKDRNAVTTQWFSVHLPGRKSIDWGDFRLEGVRVLQVKRHQRKLQRGALKHNGFVIRVREIEFGGKSNIEAVSERCDLVRQQGVPNYYGQQRFGHDLSNLTEAERMFSEPERRLSRHKRSLYLSAARSWLFNCMLSERVEASTWNQRIPGDVFMLDGRSACFSDDGSADLEQRLQQGAIHPSAALWGSGETMARRECAAIEAAVLERFPVFEQGLLDAGVAQQRRALRVMVRDLDWRCEGADLVLAFSLQAGSYATMVLREILTVG